VTEAVQILERKLLDDRFHLIFRPSVGKSMIDGFGSIAEKRNPSSIASDLRKQASTTAASPLQFQRPDMRHRARIITP
jgi:hypothetical protein